MRTSRISTRRWRIALATAAMATALTAALLWIHGGPARTAPNVVLVVIDSLRADRLGFAGGSRGLTPFLDDLAADSTVYERAYAPSSWTIPVVASLMTGQYPSEHRATNFVSKLDAETPMLAELLAGYGYATSAVGANAALRPALGFDRGFERYAIVGEPTFFVPKSDGSLVTEQALRWVDAVGSRRPHFLYLHYMDVHMPYRPHDGVPASVVALQRTDAQLDLALVKGEWAFSGDEIDRLQQLYDGEVRYEDAVLRELFGELSRRGFLDRALVIITADHGEEFGGHDVFGHGASLYEGAVHVPLLVRFPEPAPGRVHTPVQLAGLAASILEACGIPRPPSVRVDPLARGSRVPPATVFSELVESGQKAHWLHSYALIAGDTKLLVTPDGTRATYDLVADPHERRPGPPRDATLSVPVGARLPRLQGGAAPEESAPDQAMRERLRALGYVVE